MYSAKTKANTQQPQRQSSRCVVSSIHVDYATVWKTPSNNKKLQNRQESQ